MNRRALGPEGMYIYRGETRTFNHEQEGPGARRDVQEKQEPLTMNRRATGARWTYRRNMNLFNHLVDYVIVYSDGPCAPGPWCSVGPWCWSQCALWAPGAGHSVLCGPLVLRAPGAGHSVLCGRSNPPGPPLRTSVWSPGCCLLRP